MWDQYRGVNDIMTLSIEVQSKHASLNFLFYSVLYVLWGGKKQSIYMPQGGIFISWVQWTHTNFVFKPWHFIQKVRKQKLPRHIGQCTSLRISDSCTNKNLQGNKKYVVITLHYTQKYKYFFFLFLKMINKGNFEFI